MTSGRRVFQQHTERTEGSDTTPRLAHSESTERRVYKPQLRQKRKRSRSPAGPRRLRDSDAHKRIAVPQALCVLREHLRPRLKSGKVCRSDTRPGDVRERAARVEGNDSAPVRNAPCFAVCAVVCDPVGEGECVPAFTCESERGAFVREVEKRNVKRLGDKIYGCSFAEFSPPADGEGSQRIGKCMYIKAWRTKRNFADGTRPCCGRGREGPRFAL